MKSKPLIIGHRGARGLAPENTLAGFELALELGVDGVEMDVFRCATGEPVVFHDYRLENLTGRTGWIENTALGELKKLDVGSHFNPKYRGEKMPTLEEVFDLMGDRVILNLELKGEDTHGDGLESAVIKLARKHGLWDNILISSFNPMRIIRMKRIAPEITVGMLLQPDFVGWLRKLWFSPLIKAEAIHPEISMVTEKMVREAQAKSQKIMAWPANTEEDMQRLIGAGVDGIITDRPDRLIRLLGGAHG